ncbi:MAG: hypothetical protein GY780_09710 [bacterium]|nr:hypothetical protein [bacterium]
MRVFFFFSRASLVMIALILLAIPCLGQSTADRVTVLEDDHGYFPCMDCHADQETNFSPRILEEEHFEPLEWEDEDGETHLVPFGDWVAFSDLLGRTDQTVMRNQNLTRIGTRLNIEEYMEENDYAATDSVWTLVHGGGNLWCLDCHNAEDRDKLVRLNGETLSFNNSHLLCGECHGPKLRDWDRGIHGKTTGYWDSSLDEDNISIRKLCVECHKPHSPAFAGMKPLAAPVLRLDPIGHSKEHH